MILKRWISLLFSFFMLLTCLGVAWLHVSMSSTQAALVDLDRSLETSLGRERKQQKELDDVQATLPKAREQLDSLLPVQEEIEQEVSELKEKRRELREKMDELTQRQP